MSNTDLMADYRIVLALDDTNKSYVNCLYCSILLRTILKDLSKMGKNIKFAWNLVLECNTLSSKLVSLLYLMIKHQ